MMATGNTYYDDMRSKPEVIDPPQNEDMMEVSEHVNDPSQTSLKPNVTVSSSVRELLECPVCLNAMYPPIHQVGYMSFFWISFMKWVGVYVICILFFFFLVIFIH